MISKKYFFGYNCNMYCKNPELIQNYEMAIEDKTTTWICHHKLEAFFTVSELKKMKRYFNVAPRELVFVRDAKEHKKWPHKGQIIAQNAWKNSRKGKKASEDLRKKLSESHKGIKYQNRKRGQITWNKGKHLSEEHKKKISEANKGHTPWNKKFEGENK